MNLNELLAELSQKGVQLWADGDQLRLRASKGVLTPELRTMLMEQKSQLLLLLGEATELVTHLNSEAVLDSNISAEGRHFEFVTDPDFLFLTGATGFLGAFLLQELLLQTRADIYCLVRCANAESGQMRIQKNLESYGLWQEDFQSRIIPVGGDLSKYQLGLSAEQFQILAGKIDGIYHSAAWLNYVYPYSALKATNVLGTQEILRLASIMKLKPVHHVSTVAVFDSSAYGGKAVTESDPLAHNAGMKLGYSQSKWVAEKLVAIARDRGIPVCIYRAPFISGHSQTGVWYTDDVICRMIKGCILMGSMTDVTPNLDLSPVDYASKSIVYLSRQKESLGQAFHLNNPQPGSWSQMTDFIRNFGYPIEHLDYQDWQSQLRKKAGSKENPLYHLLPFFLQQLSEEQPRGPQIKCEATISALADSSPLLCPPVDAELLNTYFSFFIRSGFLAEPPDRALNIGKS